jgi:preprotein translocase subunit SecE
MTNKYLSLTALAKNTYLPYYGGNSPKRGFYKTKNMAETAKVGPIEWLIQYVKDSKTELGKVTWPSNKDTIKYSALVVVISLFVAFFFGGLDWILSTGLEQLYALVA